MAGNPPTQPEPDDAEIRSSDPEAGADSATGVPACSKCRKPMMPRTKAGDWFWGCQDYPQCQSPTKKSPYVPPWLRKAVGAVRYNISKPSSSKATGCGHPLTRARCHAAGGGRRCLLCKAELGTEDDVPDGCQPTGPARSCRSRQKDRLDELEECMEQISRAEAEVLAAAALLDDVTKGEEGTPKAMVRAAKTKLISHVTTHLDVAKNLLEKSQAAAERQSLHAI